MKRPRIPEGVVICTERPVLTPGQPWSGYVLTRHIFPNPEQPRTDFFEEPEARLLGSLSRRGQVTPLSVAPLFDDKRPELWFQLIEGERRWRIFNQFELPVRVEWNPDGPKDQKDINFASFVANFCKEGHTHGEIARYVWRLVDEDGHTREEVADSVGKSIAWIGQYMRLHHLHPDLLLKMDPPTPREELLSLTLACEIANAPEDKQLAIYAEARNARGKEARLTARALVEPHAIRGYKRSPSKTRTMLETAIDNATADIDRLLTFRIDNLDPKQRWLLARRIKALAIRVGRFHDVVVPSKDVRDKLKAEGFDPDTQSEDVIENESNEGSAPKVPDLSRVRAAATRLFGADGHKRDRLPSSSSDFIGEIRPWSNGT